jgi:hypothetical protein
MPVPPELDKALMLHWAEFAGHCAELGPDRSLVSIVDGYRIDCE